MSVYYFRDKTDERNFTHTLKKQNYSTQSVRNIMYSKTTGILVFLCEINTYLPTSLVWEFFCFCQKKKRDAMQLHNRAKYRSGSGQIVVEK